MVKAARRTAYIIRVFLTMLAVCLVASCDSPPIKNMEYLDHKEYLKGSAFTSDVRESFDIGEVRGHFGVQSTKWTGFPAHIQRKPKKEATQRAFTIDLLHTGGKESLDHLVLVEPFAIIMDNRASAQSNIHFASLKGLPMAKSFAEAQTLIDVQYFENSFTFFIYDIPTGFAYGTGKGGPSYSGHFKNKDAKAVAAAIEAALLRLKHAPRENSSPGRYYPLVEALADQNGFGKLAAMMEKDFSGAPDIRTAYPNLKENDIRAIIIPRNYDYAFGQQDEWKLASPGSIFREDNITVYYNPDVPADGPEDNGLVICAYMESFSLHGHYSNEARGLASHNIARVIDLRTGKTVAVHQATEYPPQTIQRTQGWKHDELLYWKTSEDVLQGLFGPLFRVLAQENK